MSAVKGFGCCIHVCSNLHPGTFLRYPFVFKEARAIESRQLTPGAGGLKCAKEATASAASWQTTESLCSNTPKAPAQRQQGLPFTGYWPGHTRKPATTLLLSATLMRTHGPNPNSRAAHLSLVGLCICVARPQTPPPPPPPPPRSLSVCRMLHG